MNKDKNNYISGLISIIPRIDTKTKLFSFCIAAIVIIAVTCLANKNSCIPVLCLVGLIIVIFIFSYFEYKIPKDIVRNSANSTGAKNRFITEITTDQFKEIYNFTLMQNRYLRRNECCDLYISCPMASLKSEDRLDFSMKLATLSVTLQKIYKFEHIECPAFLQIGTDIPEKIRKYDTPDKAFMLSYTNIVYSKRFLLILPYMCLSSALYEVGLAVAYNKPITICTNSKNELPYLLQGLENDQIKCKIYEFKGDILELISKIIEKEIIIEGCE